LHLNADQEEQIPAEVASVNGDAERRKRVMFLENGVGQGPSWRSMFVGNLLQRFAEAFRRAAVFK
jgi:hypothetical protein